jgi:hypothetical protein
MGPYAPSMQFDVAIRVAAIPLRYRTVEPEPARVKLAYRSVDASELLCGAESEADDPKWVVDGRRQRHRVMQLVHCVIGQ